MVPKTVFLTLAAKVLFDLHWLLKIGFQSFCSDIGSQSYFKALVPRPSSRQHVGTALSGKLENFELRATKSRDMSVNLLENVWIAVWTFLVHIQLGIPRKCQSKEL